MYNQFTALDQKPLQMGKVLLNPMQIPKGGKRKKKKLNSKNPYKIKKIKLRGQQAMVEKCVDGLILLKMLHFEHPKQVITANISYRRIIEINSQHLKYFTNLIELNCSENYIPLENLRLLPIVQKINISHNQIRQINLQSGGFQSLNTLNMSFNYLEWQYIPQLSFIVGLINLDLSYNDLEQLPTSLQYFNALKQFNLQGNQFKSDHNASSFWATLATLPNINYISVARNQIRGIHTEKLSAGNFSTLIELDFSYNVVQNQHNLICARNFVCLKKLYITGNPFALNNRYKGLEMQVYARTGAEVIIEQINPYYLKNKKIIKPQIKFNNIVKIDQDIFKKKKKDILFGMQFSQTSDISTDQQIQPVQDSNEQQSQQQQPMFVTQQIQKNRKKSSKQEQPKIDKLKQSLQSYQQSQASITSSIKSHKSKNIEYDEFHKVAAELLGSQKQYKKTFDIHTSYKALKKALQRVQDDDH